MRVLIVDDEATDLKEYTKLVETACPGCVVETAYDSISCDDALAKGIPDVIIVDIWLGLSPEQGIELIERLRNERRTRDVTIWGLTVSQHKTTEKRARAAGCNQFFKKYQDNHALEDSLRELHGALP